MAFLHVITYTQISYLKYYHRLSSSKHGRWQRGGNASNNCTVLTALGRSATFLGPLSSAPIFAFLLADMRSRRIAYADCPLHDCDAPLSSVVLNERTGTRTIIHSNPGVPPLRARDFERVDLDAFAWVHFEGRDPDEVREMMRRIRGYNRSSGRPPIVVSLDMEKTRFEYPADLLRLVDVAFVGKDLARHWGCTDMRTAAHRLWSRCAAADAGAGSAGGGHRMAVIVPWGEVGAVVVDPLGRVFESAAFAEPGAAVVDSLGAGDTFAAAVIHSLCRAPGEWERAIRFGCVIAGYKVGYFGYDCVADKQREMEATNYQ